MWYILYIKRWWIILNFINRRRIKVFNFNKKGNIYTNYQLDSFKKGYFTLTVYAMDNGFPQLNSTIDTLVLSSFLKLWIFKRNFIIKVLFAQETEKARLIINIPADKYFNQLLENLKKFAAN